MKKRNLLSKIILVIALGVFAFSAYQLYLIYAEYKNIDDEYDAIRETVVQEAPTEEAVNEEDTEQEESTPQIVVDFESLLAMNEDVIGWIHFEEPSIISYPIAQGVDNRQYLHTSLEGEYLTAGTIFVDYQNDDDFRDENTVIYGHNMKNGSMFGKLRKFREKAFCEENPYFYIYTVDGREIKYQIFAVKVVEDTSDTYDKIYVDKEEFQEYIDKIYKNALYTSDKVSVTAEDRIVTLSTCVGVETERLVVYGVVISESVTGE